MSELKPIAIGHVASLAINGASTERIHFEFEGPQGDKHASRIHQLTEKDSRLLSISGLPQGHPVFNYRSWTALSCEELQEIESAISRPIPQGCLLENMQISGIPSFSTLPPSSQLHFPARRAFGKKMCKAILAVWEKNTPCDIVANRLATLSESPSLRAAFEYAARGKRGVVGFVLSSGYAFVGDEVLVYPPS